MKNIGDVISGQNGLIDDLISTDERLNKMIASLHQQIIDLHDQKFVHQYILRCTLDSLPEDTTKKIHHVLLDIFDVDDADKAEKLKSYLQTFFKDSV